MALTSSFHLRMDDDSTYFESGPQGSGIPAGDSFVVLIDFTKYLQISDIACNGHTIGIKLIAPFNCSLCSTTQHYKELLSTIFLIMSLILCI